MAESGSEPQDTSPAYTWNIAEKARPRLITVGTQKAIGLVTVSLRAFIAFFQLPSLVLSASKTGFAAWKASRTKAARIATTKPTQNQHPALRLMVTATVAGSTPGGPPTISWPT